MFKSEEIISNSYQLINEANSITKLIEIKSIILGKKSPLSQAMQAITGLSVEEKKNLGQQVNLAKQKITEYFEQKLSTLEQQELELSLKMQKLDVTIPSISRNIGSIHPITQVTEELVEIFSHLGFSIAEGPNIETEWYNFTALNMDNSHPARQMHDTFYLSGDRVLRTHTSPVQIRTMQNTKPPLQIIAPGKVYRADSDATHTPMFHQIEGLMIDKNINMGHLKYIITKFIYSFFGSSKINIRFRPSFFPFTEPSAEVDIQLEGSGKWLEVLGCGMIHPKVLSNANIDPKLYQGFALGLGCDRFAMLKYGIDDIRQCFENDLRWIKHYSFGAFNIPSFVGGL